MKIYVAAVEAVTKNERQGETQEPSKLMVFSLLCRLCYYCKCAFVVQFQTSLHFDASEYKTLTTKASELGLSAQ